MEHNAPFDMEEPTSVQFRFVIADDSQDNSSRNSNSRGYADEYVVIMTDRNLEIDPWTTKDIVMIDDLYHQGVRTEFVSDADNLGMIRPNLSTHQTSVTFKNRSRIMVIEKHNANYLLSKIKSDVLIPRYMYLTEPVTNIPGKTRYLKDNLIIHEVIDLPSSNFGFDSETDNLISIFTIRLIFNYAVRDYRFDDIAKLVLDSLEQFISTDGPPLRAVRDPRDALEISPSSMYESMVMVISKYRLFELGFVNYQRINTIISTLETLYDSDDEDFRNRDLITIQPSFLMHLVSTGDLKSIVTVIGRIMRHSQIDRSATRRYEIKADDMITRLVSTFSNKQIFPRIIDVAQDTESHKYLSWVWKRYTYPGKKSSRNRRRANSRRQRWFKIKKLFEHTSETLFTSVAWVLFGRNTPEDARAYIRQILIDPITLPYVKKTWRKVYETYFDPSISNAISILKEYVKDMSRSVVSEIGDGVPHIIEHRTDLSVMVRTNVIGPRQITEFFERATIALEYYGSLRDIVLEFDLTLQGGKKMLRRPHYFTEKRSVTDDSNWDRSKILSWREYKDLTVKYGRNFCLGPISHSKKCDSECTCCADRENSVLFCNTYVGTGSSLEELMGIFDKGLIHVPIQNLIDFTRAYSRIVIHHYDTQGVSHLLDPVNIQSIVYVMYLVRILDGTRLLSHMVSDLDISNKTFKIKNIPLYVSKLSKFFDKPELISLLNLELVLKFLIYNMIETFHHVHSEVNHYYEIMTEDIEYDSDDDNKNLIELYKESDIFEKIIDTNDLVGMVHLLSNEVEGNPLVVYSLFETKDIDKSIGHRIMIDIQSCDDN